MATDVTFVQATEKDASPIVSLRQRIWGTTYRGIYPDSMIDGYDYAWHTEQELARINNPNYSVYRIVSDGQNIGYLTLKRTDVVILQSLYVVSEYQRQGIGRRAFDFIRDYCAEHHALSFTCHCVPANHSARRFYESMGGRVIAKDLEDEEPWKNSVVYRFDLH